MNHYFDDLYSLCRGGLRLDKLEAMDEEEEKILEKLKKENASRDAIEWLNRSINRNRHSAVFESFGWKKGIKGKYDIVYFLKESPKNEELKYSLRSVEENWQYRNVCFYGGCPEDIVPDRHFPFEQTYESKWANVRNMIIEACNNPNISDDFWLFHDDFFIMQPISEDMPPQYNGDLFRHIVVVEERHGGVPYDWSKRLRKLAMALYAEGKTTFNYEVHKPMLINKKKALKVLRMFPDIPGFRGLYGNYWGIGGENKHDMKILQVHYNPVNASNWEFISTQDESFKEGLVGKMLKERFNKRIEDRKSVV